MSTLLAKKKQTYTQTLKAKKHHELARGYSKPPAPSFPRRKDSRPSKFKVSGDLTIDEVKKKTRCSRCLQVGHWWKECPNPPAPGRAAAGGGGGKPNEKEMNFLEEEAYFCGFLDFDEETPLPEDMLEARKEPEENLMDTVMNELLEDIPEEFTTPLLEDILEENSAPLPETDLDKLLPPADKLECMNGSDQTKIEKKQLPVPLTPVSQAFGQDELSERITAQLFEVFESKDGQKTLTPCREATDRIAEEDYGCSKSLFMFETWLCENARAQHAIPDTACATLDTGCQRLAVGLKTLRDMIPHIPEPLTVRTKRHEYRFRSVHGVSTTERIGILPTSLGDRGAYLKPAIFEDAHGQYAPLLISLPFLLQCESTLQLIPGRGLYLFMRRARKKIPCHIGATGALRLPIFEFSPAMIRCLEDQKSCNAAAEEFEVLITDSVAQADTVNPSSQVPLASHERQLQAGPGREPLRGAAGVAEPSPPGDLPTPAHHAPPGEPTTPDECGRAEPVTKEPGMVSGHGERLPRIPPVVSNTDTKSFSPATSRTGVDSRRSPSGDNTARHRDPHGRTTTMRVRAEDQDLHILHGEQPPQDLLALSLRDRCGPEGMRILQVGAIPADGGSGRVETSRGLAGEEEDGLRGDQAHDTGRLPAPANHEGRDQQVPRAVDVQDLPQVPSSIEPGDDQGQGKTIGGSIFEGGDGGDLRAVPVVLELAEKSVEPRLRRRIRGALLRSVSFWKVIRDVLTSNGLDDDATTEKLKRMQHEISQEFAEHPSGTKKLKHIADAFHLSLRNLASVGSVQPWLLRRCDTQTRLDPGHGIRHHPRLRPPVSTSKGTCARVHTTHEAGTGALGTTMSHVLSITESVTE